LPVSAYLILDFWKHFLALVVLLPTDVRPNLNQKGVLHFPIRVPSFKLVSYFVQAHAQALCHDAPCLTYCGHHAVFNAVMDHLAIVACTTGADSTDAWRAVWRFGGDFLE